MSNFEWTSERTTPALIRINDNLWICADEIAAVEKFDTSNNAKIWLRSGHIVSAGKTVGQVIEIIRKAFEREGNQ